MFIEQYGEQLYLDFLSIFGEELEWKPEYEVLELAKRLQKKESKPAIYMTCGSSDPFQPSHAQFRKEMEPLGFDFQYEEWPGGHDFFFFDHSLKRAIHRFGL